MHYLSSFEKRKAFWLNVSAIILCILFLFPIYWLVVTSLKTEGDIFKTPPTLFPLKISFHTYASQLFGKQYNMFEAFRNSSIIAVGTLVLSTLLSIPASYGLARFKIPGMKLFILLFLVTQMLPSSLILTPLFIMFKNLGMKNTYFAPILADSTIAIPFSVMILRTYFISLPKELEDSAKIDGCNTLTTFLRIMIPIAMPGVVVAMVFSFLFGWGDLIYALTFLSDVHKQPFTAGIYNFLGYQGISWNNIMAFGTISIIPVVLIFIFIQKYIVSGLTGGAIKG
jgi:multiple sugar transport system permease protein